MLVYQMLMNFLQEKCVQYWPDAVNDPMVLHNYQLTMTKEKENTLFVYRLITISNNKDTSQTERSIHHFHFTQWPDHGVPDSIQLVHFYRKVKLEDCDQLGPMVVHCSAGVGRTGTFIAIDALYEHGKKVNYVNVMEYVQMMRKDRMNMIQTPGYREESRFFVTQCPMKDTVVDFYTMIYDHNSRIIVLLDQVNPNAKLWLGRPETLVIDDFKIQQEEDHTMDKLKIALKYKKQQDKGLINVFTTSDWQGVALPSTKLMVDFLKSVISCWKSLRCPITVVCRNEQQHYDDIPIENENTYMTHPTSNDNDRTNTSFVNYNLTPYGTATQSSHYKGTFGRPENAIHPPISNKWSGNICTHIIVDRSSTPADWWMFQFSFGSAYITNITIYYREGLARRMDGFKLCVTNTSITPPDNDACYEDPAPGLPNIIQTIPFNQLGKYVIYYDDKGSTEQNGRKDSPVVELCYVAINGCQQSFWGSNCSTTCADNCIEGNCFPGNGSCVWGCDPTNCLNNVCNRDTAICTDGCKKGRTGNHCNKCKSLYIQ
ncbi:Hypothetical predicted protein [Mytilus galloprovincialis]|uniref:Protein-tyrosine-phosphatase n=1 Tax=Mytilus galloprovincialis TaxID=29158 RepID=A0A8B6FLB4_MYTGA|nr:Hypothetical predicted protein [Mytilus galloprovincialis]